MNDFTKGKWTIFKGGYAHLVECGSGNVICRTSWNENREWEGLTNAHLIATAGTTATKLAEQGYDAIKVLDLLPSITNLFKDDRFSAGAIGYIIEECLKESRGGV